MSFCEACVQRKMHQVLAPSTKTIARATSLLATISVQERLQLVYTDVCGPMYKLSQLVEYVTV